MLTLMEPALFNAQLLRNIGCTTYQGAEIGECLEIASKIEPGNKESWYQNWLAFADKNMHEAETYRKEGLDLNAKMAYLRACNYYRSAYFFLEDEPHDARIEQTLKKSIDAFHHASEFFSVPVEKISIPFDGNAILGYFYLNSTEQGPKPIIIDTGGGDGTKEESYFNTAAEAIERGFHCLTIDGPGQGSVLRLNKIPFIPDWERVIEKVVDFVLQRPEIDSHKIILIGRSFGGYLAARAVTKERRIKACIVDPGILNATGDMESKFRSLAHAKFPELKNASIGEILPKVLEADSKMRFMMESRKWRFGAKTVEEMLDLTRAYHLEGLAKDIQCPMLVCDNTLEYITLGQAKKLYDQLECPKKYILFKEEDGTGGHCEPVTPRLFNSQIYAWLHSILR